MEFLQEFFHELRWSKFPYATPFRPPPLPPPPARPCEAGGIKVYHNRFYATLTATDISFCYKLLHCFMVDFVYVRQFGDRVNTFDLKKDWSTPLLSIAIILSS